MKLTLTLTILALLALAGCSTGRDQSDKFPPLEIDRGVAVDLSGEGTQAVLPWSAFDPHEPDEFVTPPPAPACDPWVFWHRYEFTAGKRLTDSEPEAMSANLPMFCLKREGMAEIAAWFATVVPAHFSALPLEGRMEVVRELLGRLLLSPGEDRVRMSREIFK